jgi:hypothetical protein
VHVFGVRHFSPAGAVHLGRFLDERDPKVVLIEGPSDATAQLTHLAHKKTRPPVALLAFTKQRPVRSIIYPMAAYSPEWVALRWALEKKRDVRFMDLPAATFLELHQPEPPEQAPETTAAAPDHTQAYLDDPWEAIARLSGDPDHETWWERNFEHTVEIAAYREAIFELGRGLREFQDRSPAYRRETLLREAFMRRQIRAAVAEHGGDAGRAVVVCGAYHAPVLGDEHAAMTDAEVKALPTTDCVLTLMPYSYPRLSSQSGYGAGNHAPAYFEALFQETWAGTPTRLPARYVSSLAGHMRHGGLVRSSAEVIEAVRLAEGLAALNDSPRPVLRDLRDASVTLLGHGERTPLEKARLHVEIGSEVGTLPEGVSRTALQDDFHALVKSLKLDRFIADAEQKLELDLREDRFKKNAETAMQGRHRSTFLHRLAVLDVGFARPASREQKGTAKEAWLLRWTPECEIRLAERSLTADSIEGGAAFQLAEELAAATDVGAATAVLLRAAQCELHDALGLALRRVQELTVDEGGFAAAALGIENVAELIRYGNVRDVDPAPLQPILTQLYLRASLLLFGATICDDDAVAGVRAGMDRIHTVAFLELPDLDAERWVGEVRRVSESDSRNPFLSGYAAALLIERGRMDDTAIDREVSRRLSPGTEAQVGVGWFEGLVQRNRAALFLRRVLWSCLAGFVDDLDDEAFKRALVYLRRAFSTFQPAEIRRVVGLLAEAWQKNPALAGTPGHLAVAELTREVERKLDAEELQQLADDLGDLDLG